jgi:hypothetical protein
MKFDWLSILQVLNEYPLQWSDMNVARTIERYIYFSSSSTGMNYPLNRMLSHLQSWSGCYGEQQHLLPLLEIES